MWFCEDVTSGLSVKMSAGLCASKYYRWICFGKNGVFSVNVIGGFSVDIVFFCFRRRAVCEAQEASGELGGGRGQRRTEQTLRLRGQVHAGSTLPATTVPTATAARTGKLVEFRETLPRMCL